MPPDGRRRPERLDEVPECAELDNEDLATRHRPRWRDPARPARLISCTNRIYKNSGLNYLVQIENAPEYDPKVVLTAELVRHYLENDVTRIEQ